MEYERPAKALIILAGLIVLASTGLQLWNGYNIQKINHMSRDLNDAERPQEAYQAFIQNIADSNTTERERRFLNRKFEGENLSSRLKFSGIVLMDTAVTGGDVFDSVLGNGTNITREGMYYAHCPNSRNHLRRCTSSRNSPVATTMVVGWMNLGSASGTLQTLWENKSAVNTVNNYVERAEYYDSRLRKNGFELKPIEAMHYTDNGIFAIGTLETNLTIGNKTINPEKKGKFLHADISFEPGTYRVKASDQEFEFKVAPKIPETAVDEGKFKVEETEEYEKAILNGSKGREVVELSSKNVTATKDIPSERFIEEQAYENYTRYRPFTVKLVSENVNITYIQGTRKEKKPDPSDLYFYGMTEEEYRETQDILEQIKKMPFLESPEPGKDTPNPL